jgi:hypothetical protein
MRSGPSLGALRDRQTRRDSLVADAAVRNAADPRSFDRTATEREIRRHVNNWRALLTKHVNDGRQLLREVLTGPLTFTPEGRTYRFEGEASIGRLLSGIVGLPTFMASPTGFEPVFWP